VQRDEHPVTWPTAPAEEGAGGEALTPLGGNGLEQLDAPQLGGPMGLGAFAHRRSVATTAPRTAIGRGRTGT